MGTGKSRPIVDDSEKREEKPIEMTFPVVGIGASAGGLEAVSQFLSGLSATTGMAFLLVQHLDPTHESLLAEILTKKTPLPVAQARNGMPVEANHVYVIPPNTSLILASGGVARLTPRDASGSRHMPVDILFQSLAEERGRAAIGVVLSGSGSDGSRGLQAIKEAGGITFAEEPAVARFADMPRSAIAMECVDFVLSPSAIAKALTRISRHSHLTRGAAEVAEDLAPPDQGHLQRIFRLLHTSCGIDFNHYKRSTIQRRLARRLTVHSVTELGVYADFLDDNEAELQALCQDLLVKVTSFFRDPETFKGLTEIVLPALLAERHPKEPLRIWVPGCSSGEEVYSIAICLVEVLSTRGSNFPIQLFGTDVSERAIDKARSGRYAAHIEDDVSQERLLRFFVQTDDHFQIAKSIRDVCMFARQDVARDPPFSKLDLVSCRNLLIYLDRPVQKHVIAQFHYALKPPGLLVLGPSESIGASADLFELVDKQHKVYRRLDAAARAGQAFTNRQPAGHPGAREQTTKAAPVLVDASRAQRDAERLLLARYAPACVLVDEGMHILYFHGETSRYLEHAAGPASLNLQKLARPALMVKLAQAMHAVRQGDAPVRRDGIRIEGDDGMQEISLEVIPRKLPDAEHPCYLILFEPGPSRGGGRLAPTWFVRWRDGRGTARGRDDTPPTAAQDPETPQLKRELESTRDYLQAILEEHDAAVEELKSSQEELLSANEEYQSTNEELETAKEELQSTNEELTTTNDELRTRNRELSELGAALETSRDYADAIVDTMGEALLVLDARFRVVRANHAFYKRFKTSPEETEQRFLYDLGHGQWNIPSLRAMLEEILPEDAAFRDYEVSHDFPTVGHKTMRLNGRRLAGSSQRPEMILLVIDDISERARREQAVLFAEKERYRITLASISEGVIVTNAASRVKYLNAVAEQYTGWKNAEAQGQPLSKVFTLVDGSTSKPLANVAQIAMTSGRAGGVGRQLQLLRRDGEEFPIEAVAAPLHSAGGEKITGVVVSFRDVTAHRRLAEQLAYQANHDALTGLVNRREFERRLTRLIQSATPAEAHALLYLDLDQFKLINDTCGHSAGDELLQQIAAIFHKHMRVRDTLARLGGDEFGVLLEHCPLEDALRIANHLRRSVREFRFVWQGQQHFTLGVSIGVVSVTEADGTLEAVQSAADKACYAAKEAGRNRIHVYQLDDEAMARRHGDMQWVPRIQAALAEGRFRLYYQPIVALGPNDTGDEWGEILLRLIDEQGRVVLPEAFIPAAERYDQMYAIDCWVITQTCKALRARAPESPRTHYAINVSGQSLGNAELLEFVSEQLEGIAPGRICFEITETAAIGNLRAASSLMSTLKARGCRFALDDFGSGLASFAYLKTLPVEYLKIEGGFIRNMQQNPVDRAIVEATHQISDVLHLKTVAESVEDAATLEALKAMGVDYAQGVAIAPPRALEIH